METQDPGEKFARNHRLFTGFIDTLSEEELLVSNEGKWNALQQLEHVLKCNQPLAHVLRNKSAIEQKFGRLGRPVDDEAGVLNKYKLALEQGGKAPEKFIPGSPAVAQRSELSALVTADAESIAKSLADYTEQELDSLVLPHPLLGSLSIREMILLMSYHALHHLAKTKEELGTRV